jgi:hypothetical protein
VIRKRKSSGVDVRLFSASLAILRTLTMKDPSIHLTLPFHGAKENSRKRHQTRIRKKTVPMTKLRRPEAKAVPAVRKVQQVGHSYYHHLLRILALVGYGLVISMWVRKVFHWKKVPPAPEHAILKQGVEIGVCGGISEHWGL